MATRIFRFFCLFILGILPFAACTGDSGSIEAAPRLQTPGIAVPTPLNPQDNPYFRPTHMPGVLLPPPTPDPPHVFPTPSTKINHYTIQSGDTLKIISQRFGVSLGQLINANQITNPDVISIGQSLTIPVPTPLPPPDAFKIIPDSELVDGPNIRYFDLHNFIQSQNGYLKSYTETVDQQLMSGEAVINRVAVENSVNPRLLLAFLEYQNAWVTQAQPNAASLQYPLGYENNYRKGLYLQLSWAANILNRGYYLWKINAFNG